MCFPLYLRYTEDTLLERRTRKRFREMNSGTQIHLFSSRLVSSLLFFRFEPFPFSYLHSVQHMLSHYYFFFLSFTVVLFLM